MAIRPHRLRPHPAYRYDAMCDGEREKIKEREAEGRKKIIIKVNEQRQDQSDCFTADWSSITLSPPPLSPPCVCDRERERKRPSPSIFSHCTIFSSPRAK